MNHHSILIHTQCQDTHSPTTLATPILPVELRTVLWLTSDWNHMASHTSLCRFSFGWDVSSGMRNSLKWRSVCHSFSSVPVCLSIRLFACFFSTPYSRHTWGQVRACVRACAHACACLYACVCVCLRVWEYSDAPQGQHEDKTINKTQRVENRDGRLMSLRYKIHNNSNIKSHGTHLGHLLLQLRGLSNASKVGLERLLQDAGERYLGNASALSQRPHGGVESSCVTSTYAKC